MNKPQLSTKLANDKSEAPQLQEQLQEREKGSESSPSKKPSKNSEKNYIVLNESH